VNWKKFSPEVKAAVIGGAFAIIAVLISGVLSSTGYARKAEIKISGFSLNRNDSLYVCDPCNFLARRAGAIPYVKSSPMWQMTINLVDGENMWGDTGVDENDPTYVNFDKKFHQNPNFYISKLNPVFDLVLSNSGTGAAVLTDIEVKVIRADPAAQGDGIEARSGSLTSFARYRIALDSVNEECCTNLLTLDPPLSIQPNDPARFQVEIVPKDGEYQMIYELSIVLWFGDNSTETDMFIVEM
jgi:hypothetical protein